MTEIKMIPPHHGTLEPGRSFLSSWGSTKMGPTHFIMDLSHTSLFLDLTEVTFGNRILVWLKVLPNTLFVRSGSTVHGSWVFIQTRTPPESHDT